MRAKGEKKKFTNVKVVFILLITLLNSRPVLI